MIILSLTIGFISLVHAETTQNPGGITPNTADQQAKDTASSFSLLGWISSRFVALAALILDFSIYLSNGILDLPAVKIGWEIVLSFANLGFVLAIIIIAFATILRIESYSIKNILWKLIVAAILVNFSLVIAGAILSVSDILFNIFMSKIGKDSVSDALANALNPQMATAVKDKDSMISNIVGYVGTIIDMASNGPLSFFGSMIISLIFSIIFTFLMILSILAVAIMYFIRALHLIILLIISPIVWLLWIFPNTQSYWKSWWSSFLRWTFFAPLMMFFIYLTVVTAGCITPNNTCVSGGTGNFTDSVTKTMGTEVGKALSGSAINGDNFWTWAANLILLLGILVGGLFISNKMGIAGAGWALGMAQGAANNFGSWTKRKGKQYGTAPFRWKKEGGKSLSDKITDWSSKTPTRRLTTGWIARGITKATVGGGEDLVKHHEKEVAGMSLAEVKTAYKTASFLSASAPYKIALAKKLQQAGELGDINMTELATQANKNLFARYNQGKAFGDIEKGGLMSVGMAEEIKKMNEGKDYDQGKLLAETERLMSGVKKDYEKSAFKAVFSGEAKLGLSRENLEKLSEYIARGIATKNYSLVANFMPKFDAKSRDNFKEMYEKVLGDFPIDAEARKAYKQTMENYAVGLSPTEAAATAETPKPEAPKA